VIVQVLVLGGLLGLVPEADAGPRPDAGADLERGHPSSEDGGPTDATAEAPDSVPAAGPISAPPPSAAPPPVPHGRLSGQVFTRGSRKPIPIATLAVDLSQALETDLEGRFEVDLPCGQHHVAVQSPGYEPLTVARDPCLETTPLVVRLTRRPGEASFESVVRAGTTGHQELRLQDEELLHTPGTLGDPFRAIESLPGVTAVAWPAPIYAVRGSNPGNTGFFLDDLRVPTLFHLAIGPSVIHPYFFQDLDFFPGGYPARYGRYVAGVVAARTRAAPDDGVHASVDVRLFDAGAMVTAPLPGQGAIAVAARYSYTGTVIGYLSDGDVSLGYWDYQVRADRRFGPVRLTLLAFGSNDRLEAQQKTLALRFHRVKLRGEIPLGGGLLSASVALGQDHTETPIANLLPVAISSVSVIPRIGYVRHTTPVDVEVGFDGEVERFDAVTMLDRIGALDLGRQRTAHRRSVLVASVRRTFHPAAQPALAGAGR
jgi:hypothetical protein